MKVVLDFYGEKATIDAPQNFAALKKKISAEYSLPESDVNELIISYFDSDKAEISVANESDYEHAVSGSRRAEFVFNIKVSESSVLYKKEEAKVLGFGDKIVDALKGVDIKKSLSDAQEAVFGAFNKVKEIFVSEEEAKNDVREKAEDVKVRSVYDIR